MPPHHHPRYCDWWYEDLPESAKKAATVLGWTKETWDADMSVPYDEQKWTECTLNEKAAAYYLGMDPLESKKLDVMWSELDEETKKYAQILTYSQETWDDDYYLRDLPSDSWYWKDMTEEQREAARFFGLSQPTWDETGEDIFETVDGADVEIPPPNTTNTSSEAAAAAEEKKDDDAEEEEDGGEEEEEDSGDKKSGRRRPAKKPARKMGQKTNNTQQKFKVTRFLGGSGGTLFDHQVHRFIESIEVFTSGKVIDGIKATYCNHVVFKSGSCDGKSHKFTLGQGEYVQRVDVRAADDIQELTFYTNQNNVHGPWGGHGRGLLIKKDKEGIVHQMIAPTGKCLVGILGRHGKRIDSIAFRWGPTDTVPGV